MSSVVAGAQWQGDVHSAVLWCDVPIHAAALEALLGSSIKLTTATSSGAAAEMSFDSSVVVLDVHSISRLRALTELVSMNSSIQVVAMCVNERAEAMRLFEAGCAACLGLASRPAEVVAAIEAVADGQVWCSPTLLALVPVAATGVSRDAGDAPTLTPREREVISMVAQGRGNKEIASELAIAVPTVKNHLRNVSRKLGVTNRWQAARIVQEQLIS